MGNYKEEQQVVDKMQTMCEESLSPDTFEMWEQVKAELEMNRKDLQDGKREKTLLGD